MTGQSAAVLRAGRWVLVEPAALDRDSVLRVLDETLVQLRRLQARAAVAARQDLSWHEAFDGREAGYRPVLDTTRGGWPSACGARTEFVRPGAPVRVRAVCTRRAGHTGRHAAGSAGRVVAVWSGPRS